MPLESAPVNGAGKLYFKKPDATHKALAGLFPRVFTSELYLPHRPLKCGIHLDLVATGIVTTSAEAHCILGPDCRRRMYLLAFVEGETRALISRAIHQAQLAQRRCPPPHSPADISRRATAEIDGPPGIPSMSDDHVDQLNIRLTRDQPW
jgi:hypothetical protein